jgi:5-methylcytosine-specific restriction enzyme B
MARIVPGKDISATLNAASLWIDRCLVQDLSVFSENVIWTEAGLAELHNAFTDNPLEGTGRFIDKLKEQISNCSAEGKQLMAEMLWAARLFPSNVAASTKRQQVVELHDLSGSPLNPDHPLLSGSVLGGIGSAGPGYNNHFWREINFIIALTESLKKKDQAWRRQALTSYDSFLSWIETVPRDGHRQFRHMLRYFAFPDTVERMSSSRERKAVICAFRNLRLNNLRDWDDRQLDQAILEIRQEQEGQHPGQAVDFYQSPLREQWIDEGDDTDDVEEEASGDERAWLLVWNPKRWEWTDLQEKIDKVARGDRVEEQWSCNNSNAEVGDEAWFVRLGSEPRVIFGRGHIVRAPYDGPHWDQARRDAGETAQFVDVVFDELRDPHGDQVIAVDDLRRLVGDLQYWAPQNSGIEIKPSAAAILRRAWAGEDIEQGKVERSPVGALGSRITAADVKRALQDIDRDRVPSDARSARYDLVEGARRYPPKYVLELAVGHATGQRLDRADFTGGEESTCFRVLRRLGFHIEPKRLTQELVSKFLEQSKTNELAVRGYPETYRGLQIDVSFGKGNRARIPWIAFLAEGEGVSRGIYPVLLLFREQGVLALCYGVSETNRPGRAWQSIGSHETVKKWHQDRFGRGPDRYGDSYVKASYDVGPEIDLDDLTLQLDSMIAEYQAVVGNASPKPLTEAVPVVPEVLPVRADLPAAVAMFAAALREAKVTFGAAHDDFVRAILASLTTKPFLILTGLSGSGKTQIAIRLGQWLGGGRLYVAAVRPDWTGSEAVFGYEDALRPALGGRSAWAVPGILEFMLKAAADPQHPYLLLLDEMNLAHVERYFADVLSGMESGQECLPNLVKESDGSWRVPSGRRARLPFPKNLWVIGTVNVDETTYMFSPKVLDRANVFEFRVRSDDLLVNGDKPMACLPGQADLVRGLHAIAADSTYNARLPATVRDELAGRLRSLHRLLSGYGLEFGHRTFYESLRFAALMYVAGAVGVEHTLDRIIIQKILPRLHGARRRLEAPLLALAHFARDLPEAMIEAEKLSALKPDELGQEQLPKLPISHEKIARMLRSLRANQFASFTE